MEFVCARPKLICELLPELRGKRGEPGFVSRSQLSRRMPNTVREDYEGVSEAWIKLIESEPGKVPDADDLRAFAIVLGVPPETFYEWPIAAAREERATGRSRTVGELLSVREKHPAPAPPAPPATPNDAKPARAQRNRRSKGSEAQDDGRESA